MEQDNKGLSVHKSESKADWTEIFKSFLDVVSGNAQNRILNETLKLMIELQAILHRVPSEEMMRLFSDFYSRRFLEYLNTIEPHSETIFDTLFSRETPDPRQLAWEDTARFARLYFMAAGLDPQGMQRRNELLQQIIANLTMVVQSNTLNSVDRDKIIEVISSLRQQGLPQAGGIP